MTGLQLLEQTPGESDEPAASRRLAIQVLRKSAPLALLSVAGLAFLVWFSLRLAATRIYQVDECTELWVAKFVTLRDPSNTVLGNISLFQWALAWIARGARSSVELYASGRFLMVELFWLNIGLLALATGEKLFSRRGLAALLGAATLAPLWDYGFEVRHDNVLLTGLLLTWCALRMRPGGLQSYFVAGALLVVLQFCAFKAFVYTLPITFAAVVFPPPGHKASRWKLAAAWTAGAACAFIIIRLLFGAAGLWDGYVNGLRWASGVSTGTCYRFAPWPVLARLLSQTPLLLALTASALVTLGLQVRQRGRSALNWEGNLPEALLLGIALAAFLINPTPFPYNLVHLVPFAFILAFRHGIALWKRFAMLPAFAPVTMAVLGFTHFIPFATATRRHLDWPNTRQEILMQKAEQLTAPAKDPIYDGTGLVPTRAFIDPRAFLHSLTIQSLLTGPGPHVRDLLAAGPAAVFIPNYRTDGLAAEDHAYIRAHYVPLADDFWVLGQVLPAGGGAFEIIHPGRYRISTLPGSDLAGTYPEGMKSITTPEEQGTLAGELDDGPLSDAVVELKIGAHHLDCRADVQPALVWVGPHLERPHRLAPGDHRLLFFNWY